MALTQERFLKVLKAGQAWKQAFENARAQAQAMVLNFESGELTKEQYLQHAWSIWIQNAPEMEQVIPLVIEIAIFSKARQQHNISERDKQRRRREAKRTGHRPRQRPAPTLEELLPVTAEEEERFRREMQVELEKGAASSEGKLARLLATSVPNVPQAEIGEIPIEQTLRPISDIQPPAVNGDELDGDFEL